MGGVKKTRKNKENEILVILIGVLALIVLVLWTAYINIHNTLEFRTTPQGVVEREVERNRSFIPSVQVAAPGVVSLFQEGHWQGMEVIPLAREIKRKFEIPKEISGVLIDEVTLLSIDSGLRAGDVLLKVGVYPVVNLEDFQKATRDVRNRNSVRLEFWRKGERKISWMKNHQYLGMAQMESAPAILAGSIAPHPYRGACTECHLIRGDLHLNPGPGDITLSPPPIRVGLRQPHRDRGVCTECHWLIK